MKALCYDCFSGISGDMNLGAMIDLGVEKDYLVGELEKLGVKGWELIAEPDQRHGISGTKVTVRQTKHEHVHRHLSDIEKIINSSSLDDQTKFLSMKIFRIVAEAEAKVHGFSVEEVHFHEVGAIDSIIDIVGAAICYNKLGVNSVHVSPVELGSGFVRCAHGTLPVPAPATAEIIKGLPVKKGGVDFEATTPTGAAILSALGTDFGTSFSIKIEKTAYGIGQKDHPEIPNILRVFTGEISGKEEEGHDAVLMECNIDDMNPEYYDHISEKLFRAGASDVYFSNIIMKKGRPGIVLKVICEKGSEEPLRDIIFTDSTSLGIRTFIFRKETLSRQFDRITTKWGEVRIKRSFYKGKEVSVKPEYDDCRKISEETGIPVKEIHNNIVSLLVQAKK